MFVYHETSFFSICFRKAYGGITIEKWVDIQELEINKDIPPDKRLEIYFQEVKTPCNFRVGSVTVTIQFQPHARDLQEILIHHFQMSKRKEITYGKNSETGRKKHF